MTDDEGPIDRFERGKKEYKEKYGVSWDETTAFYGTVGQGISFWAFMETRLVQICARLIGASDERAGVLLYSIMNFHSWLNIIDDLFLLTPSYESQKSLWGKQSARLRAIADTRNSLAHHTILAAPTSSDLRLHPGSLDARSKTKKHSPLTQKEIFDFTQTVNDIFQKLTELWVLLPTELPKEHSVIAEAFRKTFSEPVLDLPPTRGAQ